MSTTVERRPGGGGIRSVGDQTSSSLEMVGTALRPVIAYVAVIETATGRTRRRVYLSLDAAQKALDRAAQRGVDARLVLAELRAVGGTA